jgi:hypothetical protein
MAIERILSLGIIIALVAMLFIEKCGPAPEDCCDMVSLSDGEERVLRQVITRYVEIDTGGSREIRYIRDTVQKQDALVEMEAVLLALEAERDYLRTMLVALSEEEPPVAVPSPYNNYSGARQGPGFSLTYEARAILLDSLMIDVSVIEPTPLPAAREKIHTLGIGYGVGIPFDQWVYARYSRKWLALELHRSINQSRWGVEVGAQIRF